MYSMFEKKDREGKICYIKCTHNTHSIGTNCMPIFKNKMLR